MGRLIIRLANHRSGDQERSVPHETAVTLAQHSGIHFKLEPAATLHSPIMLFQQWQLLGIQL